MDNEMDKIKNKIKNKHKNKVGFTKIVKKGTSIRFEKYFSKFLITIILALIALITLKSNNEINTLFYKYVYNTNFSFASVNKLYQNYFGSPIPFRDLFKSSTETVFEEKLKYSEANKYKAGVKLTVEKNYLVPILESGIVIFVGNKEDYGNTVIIQQTNGIDVWYSDIDKINVSLYDFVEKGTLLAETKDTTLYLIYEKKGKILDYQEFIA